jgi:hypothetical protein
MQNVQLTSGSMKLEDRYKGFLNKHNRRGGAGTDMTFQEYADLYRHHITTGGTPDNFVVVRYDYSIGFTRTNSLPRPVTKEGKRLRRYWIGKRKTSRSRGIPFDLTPDNIVQLLAEAGKTIADIGHKGVVLTRVKDEGDYTMGNVRFRSIQENTQEYFDHRTKWWSSRSL